MTYPQPRLRHIQPGQTFTLRGETRSRVLIETDRHYGYFADGCASLCHPLDPVNLVWDSDGWQHEPRAEEL